MDTSRKYSKANVPRKYSINELLKMRRTLPYVSCPLNRFRPEAWTENVLCGSKVPALPANLIERRKPRRYVPEPENLDPDTLMRVETLLPMMNYNPNVSAVQRQPAAPPPSPNSGVQGVFAGFGRNISQTVSPTTGHPAQAYAPAITSPLTPTNPGRYNGNIITGMPQEYMMSPVRSSRKSYGSPAANQDTILSIEDLAKMGVHLVPPPVVMTQSPFQASEYSGGYGNLPPPLANGSRGHASQGFVPGGTLKTGPTTGLSPVNEASGMQWELGGMPQPSFQEAFSQRTTQSPTRSAFYAGVGVTDKENVAMSSTYRGITTAGDSIKTMSVQPAMVAPPPGLSLLGNRATRDEQQAFIEFMTRRASGQRYAS